MQPISPGGQDCVANRTAAVMAKDDRYAATATSRERYPVTGGNFRVQEYHTEVRIQCSTGRHRDWMETNEHWLAADESEDKMMGWIEFDTHRWVPKRRSRLTSERTWYAGELLTRMRNEQPFRYTPDGRMMRITPFTRGSPWTQEAYTEYCRRMEQWYRHENPNPLKEG